MRGLVELSGHIGVLLGHLGVALLHARRGLQQGRRSHGLDVADGQHRVAVAGEDDLALLGELEAALDGTDRLGEHRAVGGVARFRTAPPRPWNRVRSMSCDSAHLAMRS